MMTLISKKATPTSRRKGFRFFALCAAVLLASFLCYRWIVGFWPPDLSSCTRLEVRYPRSTVNYFLPGTGLQRSLLSPNEKEYIQSIEFFTVNDPEIIKTFSHNVSLGSYGGRMWGRRIDVGPSFLVDCYRDNEHIASFTVFTDLTITKDGRTFRYPTGLPNLEIIEPSEMQPFKLRYQCGLNMQRLYTAGPLSRFKKVSSYPESTEWCEVIMRDRANTAWVSEEKMTGRFKCPAAGEGRCHYALNPHCEPNSPPDTVLLFETKAGWNQHGGPELFTFDHHEPRGGCVLLNDATVIFIRTEEELKQLRWK